MSKIRWARSEEGMVESKCRRFDVCPLYCGCTRPQYYEAFYYPNTIEGPGGPGYRRSITRYASTQGEAKQACEDFMVREGIEGA